MFVYILLLLVTSAHPSRAAATRAAIISVQLHVDTLPAPGDHDNFETSVLQMPVTGKPVQQWVSALGGNCCAVAPLNYQSQTLLADNTHHAAAYLQHIFPSHYFW